MNRKTNGVQQYYQEIRNRLKNYVTIQHPV